MWRGLCACIVVLAAACSGGGDDRAESARSHDRPSTTAEVSETDLAAKDRPINDPSLATAIPAVEGVRFADAEMPKHYAMLHLPSKSHLLRRAIEVDGVSRGFLTVVEAPDSMGFETFEDTVVDAFFAGPVDVVSGQVEAGGGTFVASNLLDPHWGTHGKEFVMEAVDQDESGRWEWFWDDLLWIVEGNAGARSFLGQLIGAQHELVPPDDYDTFVIAGELTDHFADLADYTYIDLLRTDMMKNLGNSIAGPCADQWLAFGVAKHPGDVVVDDDNLVVEMAVVGARCDTFAKEFRALIMGLPGAHDESISGVATIVSDQRIGWFEDGIVYVISAVGPRGLADYRPFTEDFIAYQADVPADR